MDKSPVVREYFESNSKEENFICNIDSFQGNESNFKDFLNGKNIRVTYDMVPFIVSLSEVFKLNCFDDQLDKLNISYQNIIKNTDCHFLSFENVSNVVISESFKSISNELNNENYQFVSRCFLSLFFLKPLKTKEFKSFLKEEEVNKNIPIYKGLENLLKMNHFLLTFREKFLSVFKSPLFLKHFDAEIKFEILNDINQSDVIHTKYIDDFYSILEIDDVDSLQVFVSNPEFDINSHFFDVSLIEYSAFLSSIKCFKFLLSNHAQIDIRTSKFAIAGGNTEIIHLCEQNKCSFEGTLEIAAAFNHQDLINWLIETKDQKVTNEVIKSCFLYSNFSFLSQIIADQKLQLNDLLIYSAEFSQFTFFKWILSLPGIDIDHKNDKGMTSLHFASLNDDFQLANFILNCQLSNSVDVNSKIFHEDISPLHIACQNNNIDIVKLLLSNPKIDVNSQTFFTNRMTPLHYACKYGNYEIAELLLNSKSIRINALTYNHKTPFYYACKNGFINIVKLLIQYKADTNVVNTKNMTTPILIAAIHNHFEIVKLFVSSENVNDSTKLGETLLLLSSKSGDVETTKILLTYKANIFAKNQKGLNAIHYACKGKDSKDMIDFLISNGCNYKEETKNIYKILLIVKSHFIMHVNMEIMSKFVV